MKKVGLGCYTVEFGYCTATVFETFYCSTHQNVDGKWNLNPVKSITVCVKVVTAVESKIRLLVNKMTVFGNGRQTSHFFHKAVTSCHIELF